MSAHALLIDTDVLIMFNYVTELKNSPDRGLRSSPQLDPDLG